MFNRFKNLKLVKQMKEASPKMKWLNFNQEMASKKTEADYINMICSDEGIRTNSDEQRLEAMVREQLVKEFSHDVEKMKSFEFLVDAVMHNIKKKQLQAKDSKEDIA